MEVRWKRSIMNENGLSFLIKVLSDIESSNSMSIEVDNDSSSVFEFDIEDLIEIERRNGEGLADESGDE